MLGVFGVLGEEVLGEEHDEHDVFVWKRCVHSLVCPIVWWK